MPLALAALILLIVLFSFSGPRSFLFAVARPFWGVRDSIASFFDEAISLVVSKSSLIAENVALKKQVSDMARQQALYLITQEENADLKALFGRKSTERPVLARVLVKPTFSPFDTLLIDLGSADGIAIGNIVRAASSTSIGFVSEVYDHTAKVTLYSSDGQKTKVEVGKAATLKEATGLGGGNFSLQMPVGSGVHVGDAIVMPSVSPNIFSTVQKVEFKPTDSFERVLFQLPVNVSELVFVEVLLSQK